MSRLTSLLERAIIPRDYFHQQHPAEASFLDPACSFYFDLRLRAVYPGNTVQDLPIVVYGHRKYANPVIAAQVGIGLLQLFWDSGNEAHLAQADRLADSLIKTAQSTEQGLVWTYPLPKSGQMSWRSALAQGQAASFLFRMGLLAHKDAYIHSSIQILEPFWWGINQGGVRTTLRDNIWFEEFCITPPPFTLNGFIVSLLALRDAHLVTGKPKYKDLFLSAIHTVESVCESYDIERWSRYDLTWVQYGSRRFYNMASPHYHRFHIELFKILESLTNNQRFKQLQNRWEEGLAQDGLFIRAILNKIFYRMRNPNRKSSAR